MVNPKVLIAVMSCWRDLNADAHRYVRCTWGNPSLLPPGWDLRFFVGGKDAKAFVLSPVALASPPGVTVPPFGSDPQPVGKAASLLPDEVMLHVSDRYLGLPFKVRAMQSWALAAGYDYVFKCDVDTYVFLSRLAACGFEGHDAMAWVHHCPACPAHPDSQHPYPLGGTGYFLSAMAMAALASAPCTHWAEDCDTGHVLAQAGIPIFSSPRFVYSASMSPLENRSRVSRHLGTTGKAWDARNVLVEHGIQEAASWELPGWDGTCACGGTRTMRHPMGLRCRDCGKFIWA